MSSIQNMFTSLKSEFEETSQGLKNIEENIKKLTGRGPGIARKVTKRGISESDSKELEEGEIANDEPIRKTKFMGSTYSRLHGPGRKRDRERILEPEEKEDTLRKPSVPSQVIATQKEVKPRHQALEEQSSDKKSMARNRRMFGMILGTLQKFQSEESRRKETNQRRVEIEKKLELAAEKEKEVVIKERKELYKVRREKQAQLRRIELKMERVIIHQEWEKSHKCLSGFIQTKTKPPIFFSPIEHTNESEKRLKDTKDKYRIILAEKRAKVQKELADIDEMYKKEEEEHVADDEIDGDGDREEEVTGTLESSERDTSEKLQESVEISAKPEISENEPSRDEFESNEGIVETSIEPNLGSNMETNDLTQDNSTSDALAEKEFEPIYDE